MSEEVRKIVPYLPPSIVGKLCAFVRTKLEDGVDLAAELRALDSLWDGNEWALQLRTIALVLADLVDQGWKITAPNDFLELVPPGLNSGNEAPEESKRRLRAALQVGRRRQLQDQSVQNFLVRVTSERWRGGLKSSVLDLVDDGAELAAQLRKSLSKPEEATLKDLRGIIRPSVEVVTDDARCSETGLRLMDVWRFFRHTWSLEYRSIPGRQLPLLIRNEARPNRPVIGIAQLASPVLRTRPRDNWLGWTPEPFIQALRDGRWSVDDAVSTLVKRVSQSADEIRFDDLATPEEIANPTEQVILRLEQRAAGAAIERENTLKEAFRDAEGKVRSQKDNANKDWGAEDWLEASRDPLFVRKRSETLSKLLRAKLTFSALADDLCGEALLEHLTADREGRQALSIALQEIRKAGLASQVADLSVCGAVAPYNVLLGGKLVALLAGSREVHNAWKEKYEGQVSIISSQMAGRPISRPADLKVVTTTSLYGRGSSQYNRLKLKEGVYRGLPNGLNWQLLPEPTAGYGTVHLGSETVKRLREFSEGAHSARRINNRFGEGTSPRLRQIREGLDALGVNSNDVLNHATPRLFYVCELQPHARERLIGLKANKPKQMPTADTIGAAWRRRWLHNRIQSEEILQKLSEEGAVSIIASLKAEGE